MFLCYENRVFPEPLPLSWKAICHWAVFRCSSVLLSHGAHGLGSSCYSGITWATQAKQHRKRSICCHVSSTPGRRINRLHLVCLPSSETEVGRSVFGEEEKAIVPTPSLRKGWRGGFGGHAHRRIRRKKERGWAGPRGQPALCPWDKHLSPFKYSKKPQRGLYQFHTPTTNLK